MVKKPQFATKRQSVEDGKTCAKGILTKITRQKPRKLHISTAYCAGICAVLYADYAGIYPWETAKALK